MLINSFWTAGGIVAWPLLGFSLLAVALIIERIAFWTRLKRRQHRIIGEVLKLYRAEPMAAMRKLRQNAKLPIARIFLEALELEYPTPTEFRLALESATQAEIPTLRRFSTIFQTIITVSPLLGLLGTILGLIRSFSSLEKRSAHFYGHGAGGCYYYLAVCQYVSRILLAPISADSGVWRTVGTALSSFVRRRAKLCVFPMSQKRPLRSTSCQ